MWSTRPDIQRDGLISVVRSGIHRTSIASAAFTRSADSIATVDTRGYVYAFHIRKNRYQLLAREGDEGTAVAITDKEVFAGFVNGAIKIFDQHSGDVVATLKAHKSRVTRVEVSPAGDYLVSTSNDGAFLWDLTSPDYAKTALSGATKGTVQARFAGPTGDRVVVAFHDQSLRVYRTDSAQLVAQLDAPPLGARSPLHAPALCQSIAITPDARYVITAGGSPCLFVWDLEKKCLAHAVELPAPAQSACDAQFLPAENGGSVACVCDDGAVRVVDPFEGIVTHTIPAEESGGSSGSKEKMAEGLCVEPKGRYGAIIASKGQMRLYDLHVARAGRQKDHPKRLKTIPISADAKEAAIEAGEVAATGGPGRGSGGDEASEGQPPSPPPSKALLDAVFPPALPRAEGSGDGDAARPSAADFEKLEHVEWGPPPGTKPRLNKGRRGPMPGVAKAAPASSHVASNFPMPETLGGDFADVHKDPTVRDAMKLRNLLHAFGEFPAKYRLLTWRKMLRLPNNEVAYEALADKGIHPAIADLPDRFPISDRTLLARLQRVCSALAHWSPIFAESPIVPGMLFPFVKAFGPNEVHAFEAFATVATNHAKGWFELFPDPPFGFLGEVEAVVKYHDAALATHMETLPGGLTGAAWDLLSTLFTDVTTADEWLKLFDHVVVVGREMLQYLAAAFLAIWRDAILAAPEGSTAIKQLFVRDAGTSLPRLLEKAYELRHTTPPGMTTLEPTKIVDAAGPGEDDAPLTVAEGGIEALPRGDAYPIFLGFPKRAVDFASSERERIRAEEDAVLARQKVVKNLSARTEELRRMEAAWEAEAQRMDEIETSRRAELDQIDSSMKAEQKKWEERERIERLKQVEVIESAYQVSLARKKAEWNAELDKLRDEVDRKREAHAKEMKQHTEDEQLRSLEFEAQQRLWAMEEEQAHKSALRRVEQEVAAREAVEGINDKRRELEWQAQDDEAKVRRGHEEARRVRLAAQRQEADAKAEAREMLLKNTWESEQRTLLAEKERRLRLAAEAEAALSSEMVEAATLRDQTLAAKEAEELELQAIAEAEQFAEASRARREAIDAEWAAASRDAEERVSKMREAERKGRLAKLEAAAAERRRVMRAAADEEEAAVQRAASLVEAQRRRDRELEAEMQSRAAELAQRIAHAEQLAAAEKQSTAEEREKFRALQETLATRSMDQENEARRRHDELMARLVLEREKQLVELDTAWRKKAARSEMTHLQEEAAAYRRAMQEREAAYAAREKEYVAKIQSLRDAAEKGEDGAEGPGPAAEATEAAEREAKEASAAARGAPGTLANRPTPPETTAAARSTPPAKAAAAADADSEDSPLSGASPDGPGGGSELSSEQGTPSRPSQSTIDETQDVTVGQSAITESTPGGSSAGDLSLGDLVASAGKKPSGSGGNKRGKGRGKGNQR